MTSTQYYIYLRPREEGSQAPAFVPGALVSGGGASAFCCSLRAINSASGVEDALGAFCPNTFPYARKTLYPPSIWSIGSFRNRWLRHITITLATSSGKASVRPNHAACALAARFTTMSPRSPSTFRSEQTVEILRDSSGFMVTLGSLARHSFNFAVKALHSASFSFTNARGLLSYAMRDSTSWHRSSRSMIVRTCTLSPNRSSSCGRSSPSSSDPEPTIIKRAGCEIEIPSRSTVFHPEAAESSTTSTKLSSRRFTSSTYKIPRLALASRPGSYAFTPSVSARSMSIVPQILSSVAPSGNSTTGIFTKATGRSSPAWNLALTSGPISESSRGLEL
mmetsp:Transcript_16065/g.22166  ORF Transcript_16065/g.22166 Transcript_16065/m.22166 type:complete len:335 (+) Transcript_16065:328-1332(+)